MITALIASLGYLLSVGLLSRPTKRYHNIAFTAMMVAVVANLGQVLIDGQGHAQGLFGNVSVTQVAAFVALSTVVVGAVRFVSRGDLLIYRVVALIAAVVVWFPVFLPAPNLMAHGWGLKAHIVLSIAAYTALGFATLYAIFLLLQDYRLRHRKSILNLSLPLNELERTMMSFTRVGETLLTLSLATGLLFIHDIWAQHVAHKVVFGAIAWLIIGGVLVRHFRQGFRGRQAAFWLLGGFACLVLAYFGSAFVLQLILQK